MEKIKVMIIDDSAVMRNFLSKILSKSRKIEIVGTALDPYIAANKINKLNPDLLTLDIEMPRMDGLTFLSKLMIANPLPVIMVSSHTERGAEVTMKALELGAFDFICKPKTDKEDAIDEFSDLLISKILAAGKTEVKRKAPAKIMKPDKKFSADVILSKKDPRKIGKVTQKIIAIGASTGGTEVLNEILVNLPEDVPGIVITQHMPEKFTEAFANRVNGLSKILVKEAENNERVYKGMALIAPGGRHMLLKSDSMGYYVEINDGPPVNRHKPSVDVLFRSACIAGKYGLGIICTGMGNDGASGLKEMKESGASTAAQDEQSSVVFGMPNEAIKTGAVDVELNVAGMIDRIKKFNAD